MMYSEETLVIEKEQHQLSADNSGRRIVPVIRGNFNPPTIAHMMLAHSLSVWYDKVYLMPTYDLPEDDFYQVSFQHRYNMCVKSLKSLDCTRIELLSIEYSFGNLFSDGKAVQMFDIFEYLNNECSRGDKYVPVVGIDEVNRFKENENWHEILQNFGLIVVHRENYELTKDGSDILGHNNVVLEPAVSLTCSSTMVRGLMHSNRPTWPMFVHHNVAQYIRTFNLYGQSL